MIEKYVVNNFGAILSVGNIYEYLVGQKIKVDRRTIKNYIELLENAKIIYPCDLFDMKSKNRISYGPVLENVLFSYLKSKNYSLSVGRIGNLECDFIVRKGIEDYFYLQVSKNIEDEKTREREYKPFYEIRELYPRYLFVLDFIFQKNVDGIKNVNIVDNSEL